MDYAHLVCIVIWRSNLNRRRKVKDDALIPSTCFTPRRLNCFTDRKSKLWLRLCKRLRTVLKLELRAVLRRCFIGQLADDFGVLDCKVDGFLFGVAEDDVTETWTGGVVHMQNGLFGTGQ